MAWLSIWGHCWTACQRGIRPRTALGVEQAAALGSFDIASGSKELHWKFAAPLINPRKRSVTGRSREERHAVEQLGDRRSQIDGTTMPSCGNRGALRHATDAGIPATS